MPKVEKYKYFPILIDLCDKKVLVVGAGNIASRKLETLLNYDCQITIISPIISKKIQELEKKGLINIIKRKYISGDANSFDIVFSAIEDKTTEMIIHNDCRNNKILLNVADVPELCSFIMPATVSRGNLTISIASQGKSPFLVKEIKEKIKSLIPEVYSDYSKLSAEFREKLISVKSLNEADKFDLIKRFLEIDFITIIQETGLGEARKKMCELIKEKNE